jgi:hypothetical protein
MNIGQATILEGISRVHSTLPARWRGCESLRSWLRCSLVGLLPVRAR